MRFRPSVIWAVAAREIAGYFATPAGYVFITLFVFLSALAAFWQEQFFALNLANLDQLNRFSPYLLVFFVPAVAMSLWAEEKKQGTEELLLTLPASDLELVLGKYTAGLAIYTVALLFSLSHVMVLAWLGNPDHGLMAATYGGYWLMGAALLALAMLASMLTDNLTVAFILGGLFCALPVFLDRAGAILTGSWQRLAERLSVVEQFRDPSGGVVSLSSAVYFASMAVVALYASVALVGRRRWSRPGIGRHYFARVLALAIAAASVTLLVAQTRLRWDATSEGIHSLARETRTLLAGLDPRKPVFIQAYISSDVPRRYADARNNLINMLREFDTAGREAVHVRIVDTIKYSPQAREAEERYNIRPYRVPAGEEGAGANEIFLGLAFTCGSEEFVLPFFDRGLAPEYELMRSVRVVSGAKRRRLGILNTPANLFGKFDFQRKSQTEEWSIVAELRKQYEVVQVAPDADYPTDLDVLVAAQPSAMSSPEVERLAAYLKGGKPALVLLDPMPVFDLNLAPQEIAGGQFDAPPTPRANLKPLVEALGIAWQTNRIVWDSYNPHPQLKSLPKEFVFIGQGFQQKDPVTAGLQEMVLLYPGAIARRTDAQGSFTPLIETTRDSGALRWEDLVQRSIFGVTMNQDLPHKPDGETRVLAARIKGAANAIVVADVDLMGEQFFELRRRGVENLNFDNVTFLLNAVDQLAGDESFIALRKRRPRHRTLEAVEARTRRYETQRIKDTEQASAIAERRLQEAQARLDRAVKEIEQRGDLDEQARDIMISNVQQVENRRLTVARKSIEDEKQRQVEASRAEMENSIRGIQNTIKLLAVVLPPIPAFVVFLLVSLRKVRRERIGVPVDRLVDADVAAGRSAS